MICEMADGSGLAHSLALGACGRCMRCGLAHSGRPTASRAVRAICAVLAGALAPSPPGS